MYMATTEDPLQVGQRNLKQVFGIIPLVFQHVKLSSECVQVELKNLEEARHKSLAAPAELEKFPTNRT